MDDVDEFRHFVRLFSRIIILFAVVVAIPVILLTITAFIRSPPKVTNFQNLLATAIGQPKQQQPSVDLQETKATERVALEESSLTDNSPESETSSALVAVPTPAALRVTDGDPGMPASDGSGPSRTETLAPKVLAAATEAESEAGAPSASAPLPGSIRLPKPRSHDAGTVRTADRTLLRVPMPRPRPTEGGSGMQQETATDNSTVPLRQR
jgi:hypothetical protein